MSKWEIVRRPDLEPHSDRGADPSRDWRRFVLEQVGHDEVARSRAERRAMWREGFRRFLGAMIGGLVLYALVFVVVLAVREGRFDRYLPKKAEASPSPPLPSARWARTISPEPTEDRDRHVIQQNPFDPPAPPGAADSEIAPADNAE